MKMYVFVNENKVKEFPVGSGAVYHDNLVYANPTKEHLIKLFGAQERVEETVPEYDKNTHRAESYYVDGEVITKKWRVVTLQEVTENDNNNI